jgi:hypothetical protein
MVAALPTTESGMRTTAYMRRFGNKKKIVGNIFLGG